MLRLSAGRKMAPHAQCIPVCVCVCVCVCARARCVCVCVQPRQHLRLNTHTCSHTKITSRTPGPAAGVTTSRRTSESLGPNTIRIISGTVLPATLCPDTDSRRSPMKSCPDMSAGPPGTKCAMSKLPS